MAEYRPKGLKHGWLWVSTYADSDVKPHILPAFIWEKLGGWDVKDSGALTKYYKTKWQAERALYRVQHGNWLGRMVFWIGVRIKKLGRWIGAGEL